MTEPKRIQRQRTAGWRMPEGAVYVGRPSRWGNPFTVAATGSPEAAVLAFDEALRRDTRYGFYYLDVPGQEALHMPISRLVGKDLACWCPLDQPCHADVLLAVANGGDA